MRIVSLLPSATEIVYALGLGDQLEGVTFECDHPSEARSKPIVSGTALPDGPLDAGTIDALVTESMGEGRPIYTLDSERIRSIRPDLILAQDLCHVCAVPSGAVEEALEQLGCTAEVLSLDPSGLDDVLACIGAVGAATGRVAEAAALTAGLHRRLDAVTSAVQGRARARVLALEWADPPFTGGHWVPEMIQRAGGESLLAEPGERSRRATWDEVAAADADVVVFMPCGFDLVGALGQAPAVLAQPALARAESVFAVDATAYFSRPGPRVVDGVEALAWALHPEAVAAPPAGRIQRIR